MQFTYCAYGSHIGALSITDETGRRYWTAPLDVERTETKDWIAEEVTLSMDGIGYGFEAVRGGVTGIEDRGDIAVDDIKMAEGGCTGEMYCSLPSKPPPILNFKSWCLLYALDILVFKGSRCLLERLQ